MKHFMPAISRQCLFLALAILVSAVQADPNDAQPFQLPKLPPGKALLYVMTTGFHGHNLLAPDVFLDGTRQGKLHGSIYLPLMLEAGPHTLEVVNPELLSKDQNYSMKLEAAAGNYYYVSLHGVVGKTVKTRNSTVKFPRLSLIRMEEQPALERLDELRSPAELTEIMKE